MKPRCVFLLIAFQLLTLAIWAQTSSPASATAQVPPLIQFSNVATDEGGNTLSGVVSITFSLYNSQLGGEPLWTETQNNVQLDATGHYTVQLGITKTNGVPTALFSTGEARWLGIQIGEQPAQARVLLLSVPYALKAGDAATLGGLPPSAFVLAPPSGLAPTAMSSMAASSESTLPATSSDVTTSGGTVNTLPLFSTSTDIENSAIVQTGSGTTAKIGIGTSTPASTLDIKGGSTVRGTLSLPATGTATATAGKNSQPITFGASVYNSSTSTAVAQTFEWQAEPVSNDTSVAGATLNLLFASGTAKQAQTGLHIASNGQINFAEGQTFPGTGTITGITTASGSGLQGGGTSGALTLGLLTTCTSGQLLQWNGSAWGCSAAATGSVTSVGSGAGLTGGPITGTGTLSIASGGVSNAMLANPSLTVTAGTALTGGGAVSLGGSTTLSVDTTKVPLKSTANTFTASQTITGNLELPATNAAGTQGVIMVNGVPFVHSYGVGGSYNSFFGFSAGNLSNTGLYLAAVGDYALNGDTSGSENTALGYSAGVVNTTGAGNTFVGYLANPGSGSLTNAAAIGANAQVTASNTMVLGGIAGTNGATAAYTEVVIGATAPPPSTSAYFPNGGALYANGPNSSTNGGDGIDAQGGNTSNGDSNGGNGLYAVGGTNTQEVFNGALPPNAGAGVVGVGGSVNPLVTAGGGPGGEFYGGGGVNGDGAGGDFVGGNSGAGYGDGIDASAGSGYAGNFTGNLNVTGAITAGTKDFKIDHPLDPANKYLVHSSVESSEMMNLYTGNVVTDAQGEATVQLPDWFEALNTGFRYQLTVIGQFAQAIIAKEIQNHQFSIRTSVPNVKVSWQVTGVRQDAYAKAHPLVVEEQKDARLRGYYIHPELYGAPEEKGVQWARHPQMMKHMKEMRQKQLAQARQTKP